MDDSNMSSIDLKDEEVSRDRPSFHSHEITISLDGNRDSQVTQVTYD